MISVLLANTITAATPLLLAGGGELICERAGIMNLGVEGIMTVGAAVGFISATHTGYPSLGMLWGALAGGACALVFGWLVITLVTDQVATGLALTLFGHGLSAFIGQPYAGLSLTPPAKWPIPFLSHLPILGPALFNHTPLVYAALLSVPLIGGYLAFTRAGLRLKSVGEDPHVAHVLGLPVQRLRYGAVIFGGLMAGLAGAFLSTTYTPMWAQGMVAGEGWIAVGLVVFATWRPTRLLLGALLFAGVGIAQLFAQAAGLALNTYLLSALPYGAVIGALVLISYRPMRMRLHTPSALGQPYRHEA